jgi:hypothetical protein
LGIAASVDGNFQIKFVPAGNWKVKVSCIGYVTVARDITIIENETARCISAGYRLKGKMDQVTLIL